MSGQVLGSVLRVNNSQGIEGDNVYLSLAAAVAAAASGDTIHIEGSVTPYTGDVTVNKKLFLAGPGYFLTNIPETQYNKEAVRINCNITFAAGSEGAILAGVTHYAGASAYQVNPAASYAGNKVLVQANNITLVGCKLFYVAIGA
ncbi:MAG: hypothetical protein LBS03_04435, partial [Bacteroidales bacterium]|nr:hypothetical protein [Bacteroidales bacterium]